MRSDETCNKEFDLDYVRTSGKPHTNCKICRKAHSVEQEKSKEKLHRERVETAKVSILTEPTVDILDIIADKVIDRLLDKSRNK